MIWRQNARNVGNKKNYNNNNKQLNRLFEKHILHIYMERKDHRCKRTALKVKLIPLTYEKFFESHIDKQQSVIRYTIFAVSLPTCQMQTTIAHGNLWQINEYDDRLNQNHSIRIIAQVNIRPDKTTHKSWWIRRSSNKKHEIDRLSVFFFLVQNFILKT